MGVQIIRDKITVEELKQAAAESFGDMVKAAADIETGIIAIGGSMHADCEEVLLDEGSRQEHLWGFNIYPDKQGENFLEFESLINIRPHQDNHSMTIQSEEIKNKIREIMERLVAKTSPNPSSRGGDYAA